jgi:hypothetical protein
MMPLPEAVVQQPGENGRNVANSDFARAPSA